MSQALTIRVNHMFIKTTSNHRWGVAITLLILALSLVSCNPPSGRLASSNVVEALSLGGGDLFERPLEPYPFTFPADHGPHPQYKTEWWYYTGMLKGEQDNQFGYQLTFFRSALTPQAEDRLSELSTNQIFMAHFAITDVNANRHVSFERYGRGDNQLAGAIGEPRYQVWLDGWSVEEVEPGLQELNAAVAEDGETFALSLTMTENRMLLHGDQGLSQKGPEKGNANYYYSLVQMDSVGTVRINDETYEVSGQSWMDHEFGTSELHGDITGWDWFSVTLEDGTAIMFGEFHNAQGERLNATNLEANAVFDGTIGLLSGEQHSLGPNSFTLTVLDEWTSPLTQITYPFKWQVLFPEYNLELLIEPLIADQEMDVSFVYYEGATSITGSHNGAPISGHGYVELTGYTGNSQNQR
ncbi:MAG: lipocalin-like domain-containing protein [Chloroflexota bacterium]